jgi:uncharacterized protein YggE
VAGTLFPASAMAATSNNITNMDTISVTGTAKTKVIPNNVQVSVGVTTTDKRAVTAETQNNAKMKAMIKSLIAIGVPKNNIQTEQFAIQPNYSSNQSSIIGFTVDNTLNITIYKISLTGMIVDKLVQDGANQINNIAYTESNATQLQQSLETAAIANAKAQATQMAKELGVSITGVASVNASSTPITPLYSGGISGETMMATAVPLSPGTQTISTNVSVVYLIKN